MSRGFGRHLAVGGRIWPSLAVRSPSLLPTVRRRSLARIGWDFSGFADCAGPTRESWLIPAHLSAIWLDPRCLLPCKAAARMPWPSFGRRCLTGTRRKPTLPTMIRVPAATLVASVLLAACSSSGGSGNPPATSNGSRQIAFNTSAVQVAQQLGVCGHAEVTGKHRARCTYANGDIVLVDSIAGPADQEQALPTDRRIDAFCFLVGHGYEITALSEQEMRRHVDVNRVVARFGGRFAGGC